MCLPMPRHQDTIRTYPVEMAEVTAKARSAFLSRMLSVQIRSPNGLEAGGLQGAMRLRSRTISCTVGNGTLKCTEVGRAGWQQHSWPNQVGVQALPRQDVQPIMFACFFHGVADDFSHHQTRRNAGSRRHASPTTSIA